MVLLLQVYRDQGGWDEGVERFTGNLLGYETQHIEAFLTMWAERAMPSR